MTAGQSLVEEAPTLRGRDRVGGDVLHVVYRHAGRAEQVLADGEDDFPLEDEVVLEHQRVDGLGDRALDCVLHCDEAEVDLAGGCGVEYFRPGRELDQLLVGEIGLAEQGLLGERARRAEVSDAQHGEPQSCP